MTALATRFKHPDGRILELREPPGVAVLRRLQREQWEELRELLEVQPVAAITSTSIEPVNSNAVPGISVEHLSGVFTEHLGFGKTTLSALKRARIRRNLARSRKFSAPSFFPTYVKEPSPSEQPQYVSVVRGGVAYAVINPKWSTWSQGHLSGRLFTSTAPVFTRGRFNSYWRPDKDQAQSRTAADEAATENEALNSHCQWHDRVKARTVDCKLVAYRAFTITSDIQFLDRSNHKAAERRTFSKLVNRWKRQHWFKQIPEGKRGDAVEIEFALAKPVHPVVRVDAHRLYEPWPSVHTTKARPHGTARGMSYPIREFYRKRCYLCDYHQTAPGRNTSVFNPECADDHAFVVVDPLSQEFICTNCQRQVRNELSAFKTTVDDKDALNRWTATEQQIDSVLNELDRRIPGLFTGRACPRHPVKNGDCRCTYVTGCRQLPRTKKRPTIIASAPLNDHGTPWSPLWFSLGNGGGWKQARFSE